MTTLSVFAAAKAQGHSLRDVVAAVKLQVNNDWSNDEPTGLEYKAGRVADSLTLKTEAQAVAILAKRPWSKDKEQSDDMRTEAEHKACRAAIQGWSSIKLLAGAPNARDGHARRTPRASQANEVKGETIVTPADLIPAIVKATSPQDVRAYALRIAGNMSKFYNMNVEHATGETGSALRAAIAALRTAVKADQAQVNAAKPD